MLTHPVVSGSPRSLNRSAERMARRVIGQEGRPRPRRHPPYRPAARLRGRDAGSGRRAVRVRVPRRPLQPPRPRRRERRPRPRPRRVLGARRPGPHLAFRIREGVTFHDGRRLTAADAGYTLCHIFDKATASPQAAVLAPLTDPKTFRTPDEHTLVVTERVRELRPAYLPVDPVSRTTYQPGELAQCDRWSPHHERRSLNSRSTRCP
ncbi:ABC transporter substrate-binding protein [Streptomyces mirabilis]|uniref:ABC transporter substrate-binding protein n=1 Tax=Streptomyces mirabilis TaxID=68239 RepID=UPI003695E40B